jgi:hypothetical protein
MTDFIFTSPDGRKFTVHGPEGASLDDAQAKFGEVKQSHPEWFETKEPTEKPEPSSLVDFFHSFPRGVVSGIISAMSSSGQAEATLQGVEGVPGQEESMGIVEKNVTGKMHEPETTAGRYGASIGEAVGNPASYVGPGGLPLKIGSAALSGAGAQAGEELTGSGVGRLIGGVAGGLPGAAAAAQSPRVPNIPPRRAPFVQQLRDRGIEPTASKVTGSRTLEHLEELGDLSVSGSASRNNQAVSDAYTRSGALEGVGEHLQPGELLEPDVFQRVEQRLGNTFESSAQRLPVNYDQALGNELAKIVQDAFAEGLPAQITDRIAAQAAAINNGFITRASGRGVMPGKNYQAATRKGTPLQRAMDDPDPNVAYYATRIRGALDDAMERGVDRAVKNAFSRGRPGGPAQARAIELAQAQQDLKEARRQWYNLIVLKKSVSGAGEAAAEGTLSPAKLRQALTGTTDAKLAYAAGRGGGLQELARAGVKVLTPLGRSSGTTERAQATTLYGQAKGVAGNIANSPRGQARLKERRVVPIQQAIPQATIPLVRGGIVGDPLAARDDEDALAQ